MLLKDAKLIDDRQSADSECYFWMNDVPYLQYVLAKLRPSVLWSLLSVCLFVCGSVTTITQNCVHRSPPNWIIGKGSDHLQLIKFWPSRAPGKRVCGGAKFLAPPYCSQRAVFASPPSLFFQWLLPSWARSLLSLTDKNLQWLLMGDIFLQSGCHSCLPTDGVTALNNTQNRGERGWCSCICDVWPTHASGT